MVHSLSVGGMERSLVSLLAQPASARVLNVVCTMRDPGALADELPPHVKLDVLGIDGRDPWSPLRLARAVRRHRADIVHARNFNTWCDCVLACRLARLRRSTAVLGFHGLEWDGGFTAAQRRRAKLLRFSTHHFTSVSQAGAVRLNDELGIHDDRIQLLVNGVDTHRFTPPNADRRAKSRQRLGIHPDEPVVVMVGSLVPVKDHAGAIEAASRCADRVGPMRLVIAGDGPLRDALEQQARRASDPLRITFLGVRRDIADVLDAADLFALGSRSEQMSNALTEAMASGLPIVATDVGDSKRVVQHELAGLIVPPRDPEAFGLAMAFLLDDPARRQRMGRAARSRAVQHFELASSSEAYIRYYESLTGRTAEGGVTCAASRE